RRARSLLIEIRTEAVVLCFDAFSLREPVSTSLENAMSGRFAAAVVPLRLWFGRELGQHALCFAIFGQHPFETGMQRLRDIRALLEARKQHRRRLDGGQPVAAWLTAQLAVARRTRRTKDDALAFQHPRIAPPQRLGLAPGAVEQHDAFNVFQDGALVVLDFTLAIDGDD